MASDNFEQKCYETFERFDANRAAIDRVHEEFFADCDRLLKDKDKKGLLKLIPTYMMVENFDIIADIQFLSIIFAALSDEIVKGFPYHLVDEYDNHKTLISDYRYINMMLRRLELFPEGDPIYADALSNLNSIRFSPYLFSRILQKELFERKEYLVNTLYTVLFSQRSLLEKTHFLLSVIDDYPSSYLLLCTAEIYLSLEDYKTALMYLKRIDSPSSEIADLISNLEEIQK